MITRILMILGALMTLSGCAAMTPRMFSMEDEVLAGRGSPTRIWDNPDGTKTLEYSTQPYGHTCWMYRIDVDGVVLRQYDALAADNLARVKKGMSKDEVLRQLGQQRSIQHFPNSGEEVWDWNIRNDYPDLLATRFNVYFVDDRVTRTERSYEYPHNGFYFGFGGWRGPGYWGSGWWGPRYPGYWW